MIQAAYWCWRPVWLTKPYSNDLRERAVAAVVSGSSVRKVAKRFGVATSSVVKWSQRYRASGSVAPGKMGGHRPFVLEPHRDFIMEQVQRTSHLTLSRLQDMLKERGVAVSHDTVWRFLKREGLSFKKACSPLSRHAAMWLGGVDAGNPCKTGLIRHVSCSSTKPGSRPIWHRFAAGAKGPQITWFCAPRTVAHDDLSCRLALQWRDSTLRS